MVKIKDCLKVLDNLNIDYEFKGDKELEVKGFSSIYQYKHGTMTWIRDVEKLVDSEVVYEGDFLLMITSRSVNRNERFISQIKVDNPRNVFFLILENLWENTPELTVSKNALISERSSIGENTSIGANSVISENVIIGKNCRIGNNVVIGSNVVIGDNCKIQSGAVIGEDGFGFFKDDDDNLQQIPHYGGVKIGNNVLIGSNTCIARGTIDDTIISDYVKINNQCHIAHNCIIDENTRIIAGTLIFGSVRVGKNCWVAGVIRDHRKIGDDTIVGMGTVVTKDIPNNVTVVGNPARIIPTKKKIMNY